MSMSERAADAERRWCELRDNAAAMRDGLQQLHQQFADLDGQAKSTEDVTKKRAKTTTAHVQGANDTIELQGRKLEGLGKKGAKLGDRQELMDALMSSPPRCCDRLVCAVVLMVLSLLVNVLLVVALLRGMDVI